MKFQAVVGLGFGDEGKGLTTDFLCSQSKNPLVIRFSGGQQAGHTVVLNGVRHVFSNFGSGSLRGVPTYWSKFCTVDPIGLMNEFNILKEKEINPILHIDKLCPVTTPYDTYFNQMAEKLQQHGSCGVGFGSTINREEHFYSLQFIDLFSPWILETKLESIKQFYNFDKKLNLDRFIQCIEQIKNLSSNILPVYDFYPTSYYDNYIFEGSQGLLLDQNIGFFPHVTRSNTGSKNILTMTEKPELFLITRAYQTRHGNGPMTNENIPNNILINPLETNITNEYQGVFRRSLLDLDLLKYGINKDDYIRNCPNKNLVITCLDHVLDEHRFTYQGKIVNSLSGQEFVEKISNILGIKNVYTSYSDESINLTKQ